MGANGLISVFSIPDSKVLNGEMKTNKRKLVEAWILFHEDELMADWELAINGEETFKIDPLK